MSSNQKEIEVVRFDPEQEGSWDEFVWSANNGTLFHTRAFLGYHPPERFEDHSLLFYKGNKLLAVLPAVARQEEGGRALVSHAGASFGGLVVRSQLSIRDAFRLVEALDAYAAEHDFRRLAMTLPPQIYLDRPSNYLDFALVQSGYSYLKREVSSVIPLDFHEEHTLEMFSPESRRAVRRALKLGVSSGESERFADFYQILRRNLNLRHGVQPTHSLEELIRLKQMFPERIRLFEAQVDGRMIAGIVLFDVNPKAALAFYVSHDEEAQNYRGVNLLFYDVVRWSIRRHFQFLDFGIFTVNMEPNWGLAHFKESFGAQGIFRDTLQKVF
jgi:hypothetical protein